MGLSGLMRGIPGRRQNDLVQLQLVPGLHCQYQMSYVNRIKGASEDTDPVAVQAII